MQKISGFVITRITMSGFKCFSEEVSFDLGETSFVMGRNSCGKSSIADAIAFAVTGQPFFGDRSSDRLGNPDTDVVEVDLSFTDEQGAAHSLNRRRKGSRMSIALDGYSIRQADLNEMFGERDAFLSMFNPLYFIEVLAESGKELLEKLLPVISHEKVLAELSDSTRFLLENEKMLSPETCLQNRRDDIRELEKTLIYLEGQSDLLEWQEAERQTVLSDEKKRLESILSQISKLDVIRDAGRNHMEESALTIELSSQLEALRKTKPVYQDTLKLTKQINDVEIKLEKRGLTSYQSQYLQVMSEIEAELVLLYANHAKVTKTAKELKAGMKCPACLRSVTIDNVESVQNDIMSGLSEIVARGKELKIQLNDIAAMDNKAKQVFIQFKEDDISSQSELLTELKEQLQAVEAGNAFAEEEYYLSCGRIEAQINHIESAIFCGSLTDDQIRQQRDLIAAKQEAETKISSLSQPIQTDEAKAKIESISNTIKAKKALADGMVDYIAKRAELAFAGLRLNRVRISLVEVVKSTKDIRDVFKFTYDGRHYRWLSLSEKIRAGLEVAELIKTLTGRRYPTFIDNGESVSVIDNVRPSGQVIFAKVIPGAALTVSNKNQLTESKAA